MCRQVEIGLHLSEKRNLQLSHKESGCRCIIGQYLVAAVVYAQGIIDNDDRLKEDLSSRYNIKNPHIAVFTKIPVPHTCITHGDISYVFHGILDYGVGYIKGRDVGKQTIDFLAWWFTLDVPC